MNELQETINELRCYVSDGYANELLDEIERIVNGDDEVFEIEIALIANNFFEDQWPSCVDFAENLIDKFVVIRKTELETCECGCKH